MIILKILGNLLFDSSACTNEENYVLIDKDGGCFAALGMQGGEQQLSLDGYLGSTD